MSSWWHTFLDWLGIVGGVASLYGAWASWRQAREARRVRDVVSEIEVRVRALGRRLGLQQVVADTISSVRQAEVRLSFNSVEQAVTARVHLGDATRGLARLLADPEAFAFRHRTSWTQMHRQLQQISLVLLNQRFPIPAASLRNILGTFLETTDSLEQTLVQLTARTGAEHADTH